MCVCVCVCVYKGGEWGCRVSRGTWGWRLMSCLVGLQQLTRGGRHMASPAGLPGHRVQPSNGPTPAPAVAVKMLEKTERASGATDGEGDRDIIRQLAKASRRRGWPPTARGTEAAYIRLPPAVQPGLSINIKDVGAALWPVPMPHGPPSADGEGLAVACGFPDTRIPHSPGTLHPPTPRTRVRHHTLTNPHTPQPSSSAGPSHHNHHTHAHTRTHHHHRHHPPTHPPPAGGGNHA